MQSRRCLRRSLHWELSLPWVQRQKDRDQAVPPPPPRQSEVGVVTGSGMGSVCTSPLSREGPAVGHPPAHVHGSLRILWPVLSLCPAPTGWEAGGQRSLPASSAPRTACPCVGESLMVENHGGSGPLVLRKPAGPRDSIRSDRKAVRKVQCSRAKQPSALALKRGLVSAAPGC